MNEVLVRIQPTPNPNAWKFILDRPVLTEGKATYADSEEAKHNFLAAAKMLLRSLIILMLILKRFKKISARRFKHGCQCTTLNKPKWMRKK